jgi:hypothetical protein
MIPLANIVNKFDVRVALDQDRVIQFAGMYEAGLELPPIRVVKLDEDTYAFVDGRHRAAGRGYLGLTDVEAIVSNGSLRDDPVELYAQALEANWGGAKPPTREDITHTLVRMLEAGAQRSVIYERLSFLPKGAARAYLADAHSKISRRRIGKALDAISDGLTVEEAAKTNKLKPRQLKDILKGKKGKWGKNRSDEVQLANDIKAYISAQLFSANTGISKKLLDMFRKVDSGEVSAAAAAGVIKAWKEHLRKTSLRVDDWTARLNAITEEQAKAVKSDTPVEGPRVSA